MVSHFTKVRLFDTANYAVVDYESASDVIIEQAAQYNSYGVFAMPVHGLVTAVQEPLMYEATQKAHMIVPDGQPIRWTMNHFYHVGLKDRVYGPTLTLYVLDKAQKDKLKVFLYGGSTEETLRKFADFIRKNYPKVHICGMYREDDPAGDSLSSEEINKSGAHIVLVGRGCPRQEIWVANRLGKVNAVMMAVGAAFSFHAGTVKQAPKWMQNNGLEWLFRLLSEPQRLWKRYFLTNSYFIFLFLKHSFIRTFKKEKASA
ncbi:WecB/TagA/CpsF family glycosyltransferase [Catalinimonas niigatensis]|uniref:WecB/TagA/CpsF family glycosyltransferase n=1 Tax=Catalinimonas niigatensis TaxID=1397264 RepID=UPI0026667092|nr:WecB/TagA/CpsF family glycosyltransferase [Catalinimonas niigatensis]WPP53332.1 WecB/TagA/CpsF family glycosyltransferase [Catalinimonas niigatensis]